MAKCPECGSKNVSGLIQAFWAPIDDDGMMIGDFGDHESSTEFGSERLCADCQHEFDEDEED